MKLKYVLGIDTSCYTTSMAIISTKREIIYNGQVILNVEKGQRGLRQSNAIFKHIKNIPHITRKIGALINPKDIIAVASSSKPRPVEASYMPVFLVGEMLGRAISDFLSTPFYPTTHQEGHISTGLYSLDRALEDRFLAVHFSGGTTELLHVETTKTGYNIDLIGNTQDLHAGQFVDRIGVLMGFEFPAGPQLEQLARSGKDYAIDLPVFVKGMTIGFSGAETHTKRILEKTDRVQDVAIAVYNCLANTLHRWIVNAVMQTDLKDVLLVGGVTSSNILREKLYALSEDKPNIQLHFAEPNLAKDNAVGAALLGLKQHEGKKCYES